MKNKPFARIVLVMVIFFGISVPATTVFAFGWSTHAKIAELENCSLCSYYSKLGSLTPDVAWWLEGAGLVSEDMATCIHKDAFRNDTPERLTLWNFRRLFFLKGANSHFPCGDELADEYISYWIQDFQNQFNGGDAGILEGLTLEEIQIVLEQVFEYAMDARVVDAFGLKINDLLFLNWAAPFVENRVEDMCFGPGYPGVDVSWEFRKFMRVVWLLEKFAKKYALLLKGEIDEWDVYTSEILETLVLELYEGGLWNYLIVLQILLEYPEEINAIMECEEDCNTVDTTNGNTRLAWYELLELAETRCKPTW